MNEIAAFFLKIFICEFCTLENPWCPSLGNCTHTWKFHCCFKLKLC